MILVVGAGPAGLAVGYYLKKRGLPFQILEKEKIGWAWRNHYDSLHLHTPKGISALPGLPMPRAYPTLPSKEQVVRYLEQYAAHFALPISCDTAVQGAEYEDGTWTLHTTRGPVRGDLLVAATGIWSTPFRATFGGEACFGGPIFHSRDYQNATPFMGRRVLVVGVGNSGAEIAVELAEAHIETAISLRSGATFVPASPPAAAMHVAAWLLRTLPRALTGPVLTRLRRDFSDIGLPLPRGSVLDAYPVVSYELPDMVRAGRVTVYPGVEHFVEGGVCFVGGQQVAFDSVILATGFRPTLPFVADYLRFDERGWPLLDEHGRSRVNPALFCVGFRYPTTEGWLQAIGRFARQAVEEIAETWEAHEGERVRGEPLRLRGGRGEGGGG